jgi:hypothetical protein
VPERVVQGRQGAVQIDLNHEPTSLAVSGAVLGPPVMPHLDQPSGVTINIQVICPC